MESFFSRYRNALVLIVVLVAQLLALAVQARRPAADGADRPSVSLFRHVVVAVITPPERLVHNTSLWFQGLWFGYLDLVHVRRDNAGLKSEIERLQLDQASLAEDARQGQRLQQMLGFKEHYIYKTVPAQVIGTSGTEQSQVIYIDKGSDDGLEQDMPVITSSGIVGKLKDVFPHTSQVLLVTDPTSGVGVVLQTTRIRGILKGRAFGQLQVINVSPDSRIKAGEPILTSGGDQIFPRGLPVGTVESVVPDPERDPLVDVLVHPAANLSALEEVLVISSSIDEMPAQEAKDLAVSEAEGEAEQKRASDILSERLPSRIDPNAPADTNPASSIDAAGNAIQSVPPRPAHPDQFSPNAEPPATDMTPGGRWAAVKYGTEDLPPARHAPQPAATASTGNPASVASGAHTLATHPAASPATAAASRPAPLSGREATQPGARPAHEPVPETTPTAIPGRVVAIRPAAEQHEALKPQTQTHVIYDGPDYTRPHTPAAVPSEHSKPAAPKHRGPQLVPDDGSRPPPTMLHRAPTPPATPPPGGF